MAKFSTPELTEQVKATLDAVIAELVKQGVPAELNHNSDGVAVVAKKYPQTIFSVAEEHLRFGPPNGKVKWHFQSLFLSTGTVAAKAFKGDAKDLVAKLVNSVKERHEKIVAADKHSASKDEARRTAQSELTKIREAFPEFEGSTSSGINIEFRHLTLDEATKILQALRDAGITP